MTDRHVRRGPEDYARARAKLLPTGAAWPRDPGSDLMRYNRAQADLWGLVVDPRAADLLERETDPRYTIEMLPEWERAFGLPDPCNNESETIETRRAALLHRITVEGGQSRAFFLSVADELGYDIRIYEYLPYQCGISECGDTRPEGEMTYQWAYCGVAECGVSHMCEISLSAGDDWIWRCGPPELRFYWRVSILNTRLTWLRGGIGESGVDHHCEFGLATDLECLFRRYAPAHTHVIFDYSQVAIGNA